MTSYHVFYCFFFAFRTPRYNSHRPAYHLITNKHPRITSAYSSLFSFFRNTKKSPDVSFFLFFFSVFFVQTIYLYHYYISVCMSEFVLPKLCEYELPSQFDFFVYHSHPFCHVFFWRSLPFFSRFFFCPFDRTYTSGFFSHRRDR